MARRRGMIFPMRIVFAILLAYLLAATVNAQQPLDEIDIEDIDTSYVYPVVLGTGSYKIDGRQLSMLASTKVKLCLVDEANVVALPGPASDCSRPEG